ncbi:MAG: sulfite exporter TauE/SafE family protein, partial [Calditrichaeota bacterium]|nr:sulfite exporter TauE/SafE family protein [Calditrichota bacterium]
MADYFTIFTIGLLSSFGHCLGMCGGFVMAYSMQLKRGGTLVSPHV